ncbi:MAG: DUF4159 domain-containing protein [bacterium]|nr:DUF4159 domain-containing protein [bacterium]
MNTAIHPVSCRRILSLLAGAYLPLILTSVASGGPNLVANGDLNHTDQIADVHTGIGETAVYFTFDGAGDFGRVVARTDGSVSALKREMRVAYWEPAKAATGGMRGLVIDTSEVKDRGELKIEVWFDLKGKVRPKKQYEWSLVAAIPGGDAKPEGGFKVIAPAIWADGEPLGAEVDAAFNGYMAPRHGSTHVRNFERQTGSAGLVIQFPDNYKGQLVIVRASLREVDEDLVEGREPVMPVPIRYVPIEDPLEFRIAETLQKSSTYLRDQRDRETGAWLLGDDEDSIRVTATAVRALAAVGDRTDEGPLARGLDWLAEQMPEELEEGEADNPDKRRERDFKQTATHADRLLCLARHGDPKNRKHQRAIAHDITWLEEAQFEKDGGWATLHVDDEDAAALNSDNTSSARVVEALREAYFAGKPCERSVWVNASKYWVAAQASDGGFRGKMDQYGGVSQNTTIMRTAAGATSLLTTMDMAFAAGGNSCDQIQRNRAQVRGIRQALGWLDARYAPLTLDVLVYRSSIQWQLDQIVGESLSPFERLFYMQRVGEVAGRHLLGGEKHVLHEARLVLNYFYNRETGEFTGGPYWTALALATLSEVDAPAVLQRVVIGGDMVNVMSRDAEHLVRHLRRNRRRIMNWRDTTIDRPMRELTEVPILYVSVAGEVDWTDAQWNKMRDYCFAGGVVLINVTDNAAASRAAVEQALEALFPEYGLQSLPPADPILSVRNEVKLEARPQVIGNGLKNFVYLLPEDWSCAWHTFDRDNHRDRLDFVDNLLEYTTDGEKVPGTFSRSHWQDVAEGTRSMPVARLECGSDRAGFPDFVGTIDRLMRATYRVGIEDVSSGGPQPQLAWLANVGTKPLDQGQRARIRNWLDGGAYLVAEVAGGDPDWAEAFRADLLKIDDGLSVRRVFTSHPVFTGMIEGTQGYDVRRTLLSKALREDLGRLGRCDLYLVERDGREVGVFSQHDLSSGLSYMRYPGRRGPTPSAARGLAVNALLWAMERNIGGRALADQGS